jgi:Ca-activated chloride channel family protein
MKTIYNHRIIKLLTALILLTGLCFGQTGALKGKITDKADSSPIPFANIIVEDAGVVIGGATSDYDGNYTVRPLNPGKYDVKVSFVGYKNLMVKGLVINSDKITFYDFSLESTSVSLEAYEVVEYRVPLISRDKTSTGGTVSSQEIAKMPNRSADAAATTVGGVFSADGERGSVRGGRVEGTVMYVDGIRVRGSNSLPHNAISCYSAPRWKREKKTPPPPPALVLGTESYDSRPEQEFVSVKSEPLSTFSLDMDPASYSNVRRYILSGVRPPAEIIRTEEMINYFTYNYPAPKKGETFGISTELSRCPWNPNNLLLQVGIRAEDIDTLERKPSNLVFLIDRSGSMADPNKIELVKRSMALLTKQLSPADQISIVCFNETAEYRLHPVSGSQTQRIMDAINSLTATGSTAGSAGLKLAYDVARKNYLKNGNNRIILCSDGDFNVGPSSDPEIVSLVESLRNEGIWLTVLTFGTGNLQDSKMEKLADNGNGMYAYIDNIMEARKVLVEQLSAMLYTVAKDVKVQIEFNPAQVLAYRLIGYENRALAAKDFNNDRKDAGDIGAGSTITALYELIVGEEQYEEVLMTDPLRYQSFMVPLENEKSKELLNLKIRYKKPGSEVSLLNTRTIGTDYTEFSKASENMRFAAAVASFAMVLKGSKHTKKSELTEVIQIARDARGTDPEGYRAEFIRLVDLVAGL